MSISLGLWSLSHHFFFFSFFSGGLTEVFFFSFQRHELDSMLVKANYFIQKNCLICRFVLYDFNAPQEWNWFFLSFFPPFLVSVRLVCRGVGAAREGGPSASKSEPCKSNQLYSFFSRDKVLVNQNTFSKSHSIMRNLNWKEKPFVYYKCQSEVVTCHP